MGSMTRQVSASWAIAVLAKTARVKISALILKGEQRSSQKYRKGIQLCLGRVCNNEVDGEGMTKLVGIETALYKFLLQFIIHIYGT